MPICASGETAFVAAEAAVAPIMECSFRFSEARRLGLHQACMTTKLDHPLAAQVS